MKKWIVVLGIIILIGLWLRPAESSYFNVFRGLINNTTPRDVRVDASTHTLQTIEYEHHEIHSGSHYVDANFTTLGDGGEVNFVMRTPDGPKEIHLLFSLESTGQTTLSIYEDIAADNDGTPLTVFNNNRNSGNTSATVLSMDSTVTDGGTLIWANSFGVSSNPSKSLGGMTRAESELVLETGVKYDFTISSDSASNIVSWVITWYEHEPKN